MATEKFVSHGVTDFMDWRRWKPQLIVGEDKAHSISTTEPLQDLGIQGTGVPEERWGTGETNYNGIAQGCGQEAVGPYQLPPLPQDPGNSVILHLKI